MKRYFNPNHYSFIYEYDPSWDTEYSSSLSDQSSSISLSSSSESSTSEDQMDIKTTTSGTSNVK